MCTLEIPQKFAAQVLALNFLVSLLLSHFSNYELFMYFCFCFFFYSYGSFNRTNSTSLSFSEFHELFLSILLLSQLIESHFCTFICQVSLLTSSCQFSTHHSCSLLPCASLMFLVSFHHASSRFLRVPDCSSSGLLLIGPEASHLATI